MADVVIAEFMDEAAVARVANRFPSHYDPQLVNAPDELASRIVEARALIVRNRTQVRSELLKKAMRLECIGRLGVGLDNIDLDTCKARGIAVYPAVGANDIAVAEYVLNMALTLLRGVSFASREMAAGKWPRQALMGREATGKAIGLVGLGSTASAVARRAAAMSMKVAAHDPFVDAADPVWQDVQNVKLDDLLRMADVISLHVPLTGDTRHLIGAQAFRLMKNDAVLINAARGGVVDERALVEALKAGSIAGAALDVFETEPLTAEAGRIFAGVPNLILTPHIAGVTEESNIRVSELTAESVIKHLERKA